MGIDPAQTLAELIALSVSTSASAYLPKPSGPLPKLQDAQQLSEVAAKIEAAEPLSVLEAKIMAGCGSPGGAKPKALITATRATHTERADWWPVRIALACWLKTLLIGSCRPWP